MKYKERRPNYYEVKDFRELARTDCVAGRFAQSDLFLKFSWENGYGYDEEYPYCLMAEMKDGSYWILGYIDDKLDLPEWNYDECEQRKIAYKSEK